MERKSIVILIALLIGCSPYSLPEPKESIPREDAFTYYQESMWEYEAGRYQNALEKIQYAITIHQNFAQFFKLEGDIYKDMMDHDRAIQSYEKAILQRSNFIEVHKSMGEIYVKQGNYQQAIKSYRKILALDPKELDMYLRIAQCYIALEELEIALNNLTDYARNSNIYFSPETDEYYVLKGIAYYNLSRYEDVVRELGPLERQENINSDILYLLGRSYYALDKYEEGLRCFNRLITRDGGVGEYFYYRGIYFYIKEDYVDALEQLNYALQLDHSLGKAHYYLGKIYEHRWDVHKALSEFRIYRESDDHFDDIDEIDEIILKLENLKEVVTDSSR